MKVMLCLVAAVLLQDTGALVRAARDGNLERVRTLLERGADPNGTNADGRTALMEATARGDLPMAKLLLAEGAVAAKRDREGVGALTIAKAQGSIELVDLLRAHGAEESLEELLAEAVRSGDVFTVSRLIERGADVNALDTSEYQTPLMNALELRELEVFLRLVEAGADPTREGTGIRTSGENAISVAARENSPWALRLLLESGVPQEEKDRALLLGCGSVLIVRVALEAGARTSARGRDGETPLICAASAGAADAVAALLAAGADKTATTPDGRTAADWAELGGFRDVAALLSR